MNRKTALRNREIFASHQKGVTPGDLAKRHGLAPATVRQIIVTEKHLHAVSNQPIYKAARAAERQSALRAPEVFRP
jgi:Mor family transcriptional regulator